jgi:flagellar basal-body rod modification protein FlgD
MAQINAITSMSTGATTAAKSSNSMMDKDTFLKLLVEQLRHQDPTAPADSSQWTAQMAQFSTVEQLTNLTKSTTQGARSAAMTEAVGLLGRTVSYVQDGSTVQGKVERVDVGSDGPTLTIGGHSGIAPDSLVDVS